MTTANPRTRLTASREIVDIVVSSTKAQAKRLKSSANNQIDPAS
ncbi:hypothetical protein OAG76_03520 [Rubripirellula sp.]|nr:hypothetical protein [Rubripirellula sp.]